MKDTDPLKRLSSIISIQTEIATAGLELDKIMQLVVQRIQVLTGASGGRC